MNPRAEPLRNLISFQIVRKAKIAASSGNDHRTAISTLQPKYGERWRAVGVRGRCPTGYRTVKRNRGCPESLIQRWSIGAKKMKLTHLWPATINLFLLMPDFSLIFGPFSFRDFGRFKGGLDIDDRYTVLLLWVQ